MPMTNCMTELANTFLQAGFSFSEAGDHFDSVLIMAALRAKRGNQVQTAKVLGMHRNTLSRYIRLLKIDSKLTRRRATAAAVTETLNREQLA